MSEQLPLSLSLRTTHTLDTFACTGNEELCEQLHAYITQLGTLPLVYIWSAAMQGKTHLLSACCHLAYKTQLTSTFIPLGSSDQFTPEILSGLENMDLVCLDDAHLVAGKGDWELAIFNLFNAIQERGGRLIFSSDSPPQSGHIQLADLRSRLGWGLTLQIARGSDTDRRSILQKMAAQKGLKMPPDVANYLLKRQHRDIASFVSLIRKLDVASLSAKRPLTIPFVSKIIT